MSKKRESWAVVASRAGRNPNEITLTLDEIKSLFCTKKDIENLAVTGDTGHCLSWLNRPFCWFEDALPRKRKVYRKMAKQMNFLRKLQGKKPLEKGEERK